MDEHRWFDQDDFEGAQYEPFPGDRMAATEENRAIDAVQMQASRDDSIKG
ncbi:MAG: hypothetical protein LBQ32_12395 [Burkholderiaceae bacterium]|jgi:hypothetical protein|nr:hypothetical protein [Burkholderiaceae bacterium]